ncbi:hypothetical protein CSC2_13890 [Clostridium zeae]|uniref:DUF4872 domain-containing protein n=1 Tax=Clostridium zeae TaxID=2759022 RepID=A0ABQ1E7X1_9CLOT|nr:DUF4872 domain-containing protein [Clostridium zeae]GFZ30863.1 hypothetical protein CSC2_13890 [Clostridium zeae]
MLLKKIIRNHEPTSFDVPHIARLYAEICNYYGYNISPHMAFGIGMGMSFEYMRGEKYQLSPDFIVEGTYFAGSFSKDRRRLAKHLRVWLDVYRGNSDKKAYESYVGMLSQGIPIIAEVNLTLYHGFLRQSYQTTIEDCKYAERIFNIHHGYYLNGYSIIIAGIDEETRDIICLDVNLNGTIIIPYNEFMKMHSHREAYINAEYEWIDILIPKHKQLNPPKFALLESIKDDISNLESPVIFNDDYIIGIDGMKQLYLDIKECMCQHIDKKLKDAIEKIYYTSEIQYGRTGLYRKTYAQFLYEASEYYPVLLEPARLYEKLAEEWSEVLNLIRNSTLVKDEVNDIVQALERIVKLEVEACTLLKCTTDEVYEKLSKSKLTVS